MNIKQFVDGNVDKDWVGITSEPSDIKETYEEILFEMKEYQDRSRDDFVVLSDKVVYRTLVLLKHVFQEKLLSKFAESEVIADLQKLAQDNS